MDHSTIIKPLSTFHLIKASKDILTDLKSWYWRKTHYDLWGMFGPHWWISVRSQFIKILMKWGSIGMSKSLSTVQCPFSWPSPTPTQKDIMQCHKWMPGEMTPNTCVHSIQNYEEMFEEELSCQFEIIQTFVLYTYILEIKSFNFSNHIKVSEEKLPIYVSQCLKSRNNFYLRAIHKPQHNTEFKRLGGGKHRSRNVNFSTELTQTS